MAAIVETDMPLDRALLEQFRDQSGRNLAELTDAQPQVVVFLRHSGCPFCRQAASDIAAQAEAIAATGAGIVLVHMMPETEAATFFGRFGVAQFPRISDPDQRLYEAFDLRNGTVWQLLGPKAWWEGAKSVLGRGQGVGWPTGNVLRLPGSFLVSRGRILKAYRSETSSDRPDYTAIAACELPTR